jgi:hypothetical protein
VEDLSKALHGVRSLKADKESAKWEAERALLHDEIEQSKGRERQAVVRFQNTMQEVRHLYVIYMYIYICMYIYIYIYIYSRKMIDRCLRVHVLICT